MLYRALDTSSFYIIDSKRKPIKVIINYFNFKKQPKRAIPFTKSKKKHNIYYFNPYLIQLIAMHFPKLENHNLLLDIFENKNGVPNICEDLLFKTKNKTYFKASKKISQVNKDSSINSIKYIPGYLYATYRGEATSSTKVIRCIQEKGYAIDLEGVNQVESYIKKQFNRHSKNIKRSISKLDTCFNIRYSMYYGEIDKDLFDDLMQRLHQMIVQRFMQRNETSESIVNWSERCKRAYPLIKEKRACLFVIYDDKKPISISLNYNFNLIHFNYISSYDIDYAKFGLGHINIYKQLEWCIANHFNIFEMGWGTLDYKCRWSNNIYKFEHHLVFSKKSIPTIVYAYYTAVKIKVKSYLVSKNVHVYTRNIKNYLRFKNKQKKELSYTTESIEKIYSPAEITKIDHNLEAYSFLRKIVYDFLYSNTLHETKVTVYKIDNELSYILDGGKSKQKVVLNKTI
tara:strand:+ start:11072 stop:12439 length:1368 start_codon:yes stop_codon:yes gene_type:complete